MGPEEPSFRVTDKLAHPEPGCVRLSPVNMAAFVAINFYVITMNFSCLFLSQSGMSDLWGCEDTPRDIFIINPLFKGEEGVLCGDDRLVLCHVTEPVWSNHIAAGIDVRGGGPKGGIGPDPLQGVFDPGLFKIKSFDIRLPSNGHEGKGDLPPFHAEFLRLIPGQEVYPFLCQFFG